MNQQSSSALQKHLNILQQENRLSLLQLRDVVYPYGENRLVHIVSNAEEFIEAAEMELDEKKKDDMAEKGR